MTTITDADIKKLAGLARLKLTEEETKKYAEEITGILKYVDQIQEVSAGVAGAAGGTAGAGNNAKVPEDIVHRNVMRQDIDDRNLIEDTSKLVASAPASEDGLIKVKKILS